MDSPTRFMTGAEVAALLRASESTVRYWKYIGKLQGVKVGRRNLFERSEVDAFIAAGTKADAA